MKKICVLSLALGLSLFTDKSVLAQCNASSYTQECVSKVQDGFTFLKSFNVDGLSGNKEKIEYSYVFSKDTEYYLNICSEGENTDGIVVTIYDANRKVASTNFTNEKYYPGVIFACRSTGIYYITYTFKNSLKFCGGSVLAFKR